MEKFGLWRDKATGVHPFLPPKVTYLLFVICYIVVIVIIGYKFQIEKYIQRNSGNEIKRDFRFARCFVFHFESTVFRNAFDMVDIIQLHFITGSIE